MARRKRGLQRPTTRGGWRAPGTGTRARKAMPRSAFLLPGSRKYPYKVKRKGVWVASEKGLMAAYRRAAQQGNTSVKNQARAKLNRIRKRKGKPPVGGRK